MPVNLNLEKTLAYIAWMAVSEVTGLYQAALKKSEEIGVAATRRKSPALTGTEPMTGNTKGILRFIDSLTKESGKSDKRKLGVLLGALETRAAADGVKPAKPVRKATRRRRVGKTKTR